MLKVELAPYRYTYCYDCARSIGDPRIIGKARPKTYKCTKCDQRFRADQLTMYKDEPLCSGCLGKIRARREASHASMSHALHHDGTHSHAESMSHALHSTSKGMILGDQLKAEAHDRSNAMAKALSPRAGFFDGGALQDAQRVHKRAEAIARYSSRPQPRAFFSIDALVKAQKNSRKADGLSGPAPGDATGGAEQVAVTDRAMPRSYGARPSQRDDSFIDILPGGAAVIDPASDPYSDSTNLRPGWVPDGVATPVTLVDANQRDTGGIRLFTGDSSAFFKPASPTDRFVGSNLVVRSPSRAQVDMGKVALDLAMKLRLGPKFFERNV